MRDNFINRGTGVTAGSGKGWVMSMVDWAEEIVFIKTNGTRMTWIARIRADLGFLNYIFLSAQFNLIEYNNYNVIY